MLHITPWTLMLMLHIRQSIYLVLTNVFLLHFWLSTLYLMKFHYNSKVRIYHYSTCIEYIYLYQNCTYSVVLIYMFVRWNRFSATSCIWFCYWRQRMLFTHVSKIACSCFLMDSFLTSWTFKITTLLNLNEYQCY